MKKGAALVVKRTPLRADLMLKSIDTAPPGKYAARFARTDKRAHVVEPDFRHEGGDGAAPAGVRMRDADPVLAPAPAGAWPRGVWRTGASPL